jgi:phosphohistidine phosphatase
VQVFLIRHAHATDETLEVGDAHRPLSAHGRTQAKRLGEKLRWYDCGLTHVWSSPLVRALQTAELVIAGLEDDVTLEVVPALEPGGATRTIVAALRRLPEMSSVMLVGHEPGISLLGEQLLGIPDVSPLARAEALRIVDGKLRWRFGWDDDAPTAVTSSP